ncbi:MAG TPA: hypothetical protein QGF35_03940, partial [Dehalococcoidia bacterium]|nr:hypothetical protein [Dehalococcoidia bacterium]
MEVVPVPHRRWNASSSLCLHRQLAAASYRRPRVVRYRHREVPDLRGRHGRLLDPHRARLL